MPGQGEGVTFGIPPSAIRGQWLGRVNGWDNVPPSAARVIESAATGAFCPGALSLSAHWPSARMAVLAARGGEVTVMVPAEVADRFNKALVRGGRRKLPRRTLGCCCPNY